MISFKGAHFPKEIILYSVFFYVRYGVSYRDLEEIMEERGVNVDHATLNRWGCQLFPADHGGSQETQTSRSFVLAGRRNLREGQGQMGLLVPCRRQTPRHPGFHAVRTA